MEEKFFKKVKNFRGGMKKKDDDIDYKTWIFDLLVAINKVDSKLGLEVKKLIARAPPQDWDPDLDPDLDLGIHEGYKEELFALLVGLTEGEAKGMVKSIVDRGLPQDGF